MYKDHPLYECAKDADAIMQTGATVYQKFTCARCRSRQTVEEKNTFFTHGKCEECHHITDLELAGCNYLVIWSKDQITREEPE